MFFHLVLKICHKFFSGNVVKHNSLVVRASNPICNWLASNADKSKAF